MNTRRSFLSFSLIALASGCGPEFISATPPSTNATVVTSTFLSASLSDDCGSTAGAARESADCAAPPRDAGTGTGLTARCGYCRQSNMQIRFVASAGEAPAHIEVVTVRLLDASTSEQLDTLTAREPTSWNATTGLYDNWSANVSPSSTVQASWKLSAPRWDRIASPGSRLAYTRRFVLEIVLRVDGVERRLRSGDLTREPEVVT